MMLNSISLEDIGLESIVVTALVFCGADFITNIFMFFTFDKIPRKKGLLGFHVVIFGCGCVLLGISVFGDYLKTRWVNLCFSFVIKISMCFAIILFLLFKGRAKQS